MESPLDRIARALGDVPIGQRDGRPVHLGLTQRLDFAQAALAALAPELDRLRELEAQPAVVLPAKFVTDAMAHVPDSLPPDFT